MRVSPEEPRDDTPSRLYSGGRATFHFCPACGATVYYLIEDLPEVIAVPVGAFADPSFPAPRVSVYEERMHSWTGLPPDVEHID